MVLQVCRKEQEARRTRSACVQNETVSDELAGYFCRSRRSVAVHALDRRTHVTGTPRMSGVVNIDFSDLRLFRKATALEWRNVCLGHHSLLLQGPKASTQAALHFLTPHLASPVFWKPGGAQLELPESGGGVLVLHDVGDLTREAQARLMRWLDHSVERKQVVSTSEYSLFGLVARGLFDEALYYRLNVVLLNLDGDGTSLFEVLPPSEKVVPISQSIREPLR
jgi:hypothetical protein